MIAKDKLKPFIILFVCMAALCLRFWITSRYPDLASKAALGGSAPLSGLGFGPLYEIKPDASVWDKLFYGTINWLDTNRRGMTFAFLLGAFLLSLLPLIQIKRLKGGVKNSFLGLVMGTPLGLCVNCSAPVARSLQASGMALETALALLISSPTMNVVVLTMAFTFFPFYVVAGKILLILLFVLLIIPMACHYIFKDEVVQNDLNMKDCDEKVCQLPEIKGWGHALVWSFVTYIKNLVRIVIMTGPLMVVAGFAGTVIITFLPWGAIEQLGVDYQTTGIVVLIMLGIAIVGALLPAPMAFDVAISAALLQAGLPMYYVAVFLFTLGSYSIYAFFIVWQAVSLRVAAFLLAVAVMLGLLMGASTLFFEKYYLNKAEKNVTALVSSPQAIDLDPIIPRTDTATDFASIKAEIEKAPSVFEKPVDGTVISAPENLAVEWRAFKAQEGEQQKKTFTRLYGDDLGILQPYQISYISGVDIIPRITTSIATGDVHNDGWEDVLLLGDHEVAPNLILYSNIDGERFERQVLPAAEDVILVALADLNGDDWLDIIYTTFMGKNFVIYNDKGDFREENRKRLNSELPGTTNSISFGDLNKDGVLEIFLGNWSVGPHFLNNSRSKDILLTREGETYSEKILPGLSGETLASMMWDFNKDGNLDLYIGNDFMLSYISDLVLMGDGKGALDFADDTFVKSMPGAQSTMSIDVGDINNDLNPEYFIGHLAYIGQYVRAMSKIAQKQISYDDYCAKEGVPPENMQQCQDEVAFKLSLAKVSHYIVDACEGLKNETHKKMCEVHLVNYKKYCIDQSRAYITDKQGMTGSARYKEMCSRYQEAWMESNTTPIPEDIRAHHLAVANESISNILLSDDAEAGKYKDISKQSAVGYGGWTWNTKFADLDNDGWQDIYVSNGYTMPMAAGTKLFYRNKRDGSFEDVTDQFGLTDYSATAAYSYVDYDHDGDVDIIAVPLDGPVKIFRNNTGATSSALQIELDDKSSANTHALGAKIVIRYMLDGKDMQQIRVIKGSGGYKSFDAAVAYFGLGKADSVKKIEIEWPDGKTDALEGNFKAGGRYRITRS